MLNKVIEKVNLIWIKNLIPECPKPVNLALKLKVKVVSFLYKPN